MYTKIFCSECDRELRAIFTTNVKNIEEYVNKDSALTYRPLNICKMVEYDDVDLVEYDYEEEYISYKCDNCNIK